jgi:hypothetical protein
MTNMEHLLSITLVLALIYPLLKDSPDGWDVLNIVIFTTLLFEVEELAKNETWELVVAMLVTIPTSLYLIYKEHIK